MCKILKYKTFIAFMLVFTLSFGVVSDYKKKEVQAFDLVITPTMLYTLGSLVLATGVVALNGEQIVDMGKRVVDRINDNAKLRGQFVFDGAIAVGIKIDSFIKDAVSWVAENLPAEDKLIAGESYELNSSEISFEQYAENYKIGDLLLNGVSNGAKVKVGVYYPNGNTFSSIILYIPKGSTFNLYFAPGESFPNEKYPSAFELLFDFVDDFGRIKTDCITSSAAIDLYKLVPKLEILEGSFSNAIVGGGYIPIPYSNPKVRENYDEDKLPVALPWTDTKQGYIPIPTELPDTSISTEMPLTWDNVKDTVIPLPVDPTEAPSIPDVGDYELPSDLPVDDSGDITKGGIIGGIVDFFSWLWELLKALLMGILNLLKAILDLLLGLVNALLTGLKDLLIYLFVPSDTYFTDVFNDFKNDLFNKLDITSYTRLFDTDYTESSIKDITINVFGQTVTIVKFSMYEDFRGIVNTLIYAFMFFLLAIYNYNQIYKLIRGSDYVSASTTITHMGGGLTPAEQLKADSINRRLKKL